jgi:hypothetical protein
MQDQHGDEDEVDGPRLEFEPVVEHPDEVCDEHRQRIVDRSDHPDLADEVEITGNP